MLSKKNLPQPIPYQGSKRQLASTILRYLPSSSQRFVEPFCGSCAMSIAMAAHSRASQFWLNDAHRPLMDLWSCILHDPERLSAQYEHRWKSQSGRERDYFNLVRARFNRSQAPADFLYILARCVKAAIRYNNNGEFNNTPDNRRAGARPDEMRRRILQTSFLLTKRTKLTSTDYKTVLAQCDSTDLIYMDPPYQGVCGKRDNRYAPTVGHDEFCAELRRLNDRECLYAVSYDGRTGTKTFGEPMPDDLDLTLIEIRCGPSTQATLLGRSETTYESLYLSPALAQTVPPDATRHEDETLLFA